MIDAVPRSFGWRVDDAVYRLSRATHDRCWVLSLCFKDLFHYAEKETAVRTEELREVLHVQAAAAAVVVDGGERYHAVDAGLKNVTGAQPAEAPKPGAQLRPDQIAAIERARAETDQLWSK